MEMEEAIGITLRAGVVLCITFMSIGVLLLFIDGGGAGIPMSQITGLDSPINSSLFSLSQIVHGVIGLDGISFILLGLVVLIATPIARVLLSVFVFLFEENWLYLAITLVVFINLMVAIFLIPMLIAH